VAVRRNRKFLIEGQIPDGILERTNQASGLGSLLYLECGDLSPLWDCWIQKSQSGDKSPHSKPMPNNHVRVLSHEEEPVETQVGSCLVASGNTYNPCLIVLRHKGYELWLEKGDSGSLWCAKKGDQSFLAYSGPELLGLVALWEHLGQNWNQQQPDIYSELLDKMED
jgi:hypothetical protein